MKIRAAAIQFNILIQDRQGNLDRAMQGMEQAVSQGAELLLLPELWNCGYDIKHLPEVAEPLTGPSVSMLREFAVKHGVTLIGGSIIEKKHDNYYNCSPLIGPDGQIAAKYRKVHLFTYHWQEHLYFKPGEEWTVCPLPIHPGLTLGMSICYDLRFPEFYRNMALRGARLFTAPSIWPIQRASEFELLCRARASENRAFLISANRCGGRYNGNSLIVDPFGDVLARAGENDHCAVADLDTDIFQSESYFNSLADRRQYLDEIDDSQI